MAGYAKLNRSIWTDPDFTTLSDGAQRVYLLLISQPDLSTAGVLPYTPGRWSKMCPVTTTAAIEQHCAELEKARFVHIDTSTEELLIRSHIAHDRSFTNPNGKKSLVRSHSKIHSRLLSAIVHDLLERYGVTATEAPTEGAYQGATEGATSPQQPAASNHEPLTSSQQPHVDPWEVPAAAAALEMYLEHRRNNSQVDNPGGWTRKVREATRVEFAQKCADYLTDDCDASDVLTHVFGLNELDTFRLTGQTRKGA